MATEQELSELKFKVQGLEQDIRELQAAVNVALSELRDLHGHDKGHPANKSETPAPQRGVSRF